jgi:acetoin utilization deacetylase AcuC-like enzyme
MRPRGASRCAIGGCERVAVLDIDYHHGNGTQAIFYERADVMVTSVHGDPHTEYPYYLGYADERGTGRWAGLQPQSALATRHRF